MPNSLKARFALRQLIYPLSFPLLVFAGAWVLLVNLHWFNPAQLELIGVTPYMLIAAAMLLGLRFNQSRIIVAGFVLIFLYWAIGTYLQRPLTDPQAQYIYTAISFLLPLNLLVILLTPERGLRHSSGLVLIGLIPLQLAVLWLGWRGFLFDTPGFLGRFSPRVSEDYVLANAALIWFALSIGVALVFVLWRRIRGSFALLLILISVFVLLLRFDVPQISTAMILAASLFLLAVPINHAYSLAYHDELTGLLGRRALNERLRAPGRNYCVAMIDIDHFKKFNDTYGHDAGDDVLKVVAKNLSGVGGNGIPYRYGGEEFTVFFAGSSVEDCVEHLEELRRDIAVYDLKLRDKKHRPVSQKRGASRRGASSGAKRVRVTISIGLAERANEHQSAADVIKAADKALYRAKGRGRNNTVVVRA